MSTPSTKCPKCGSVLKYEGQFFTDFKCGSSNIDGKFKQSQECQISTLRASLLKAVEALKPFADMVPRSHMSVPDETEVTWETEYWNGPGEWAENWPAATVGDLRRASSVLKEISKDL